MGRIVRTILNYHDTRIIEVIFGSTFFETLLAVLKRTIATNVDSECNSRHQDYLQLFHQRFQQRKLLHFDQVNN
jgi:hypothetical protein